MKKNFGIIFRIFLMVGDLLAVVVSFLFAYFVRTNIDSRPFYFNSEPLKFMLLSLLMLPIWLIILSCLGLYKRQIMSMRFSLVSRLFLASLIGIMTIISIDFFLKLDLFPVRPIAIYAFLICFIMLNINRLFIKKIYHFILYHTKNHRIRAVVIGNSNNTTSLLYCLQNSDDYELVSVVSRTEFVPKEFKKYKYRSLRTAIFRTHPDAVFQTDETRQEKIYRDTLDKHMSYYFVPPEFQMSQHYGELELIGTVPTIEVKLTPLTGSARFIKRTMDIILGILLIIIFAIPMCVIAIIIKISDPKNPVLYSQIRLSRFNKRIKIYKYRSIKIEYSGLTPEDAFLKYCHGKKAKAKILSTSFRKNGDYLTNDPRLTNIGKFLRRTSLDELPQLFNVVKGDISLVGPRALVPGELKHYGNRSLILSVKSGLTGLAQVSGRRSISFKERRALDLYYVENWSVRFDIKILLRTIKAVFKGTGAK